MLHASDRPTNCVVGTGGSIKDKENILIFFNHSVFSTTQVKLE